MSLLFAPLLVLPLAQSAELSSKVSFTSTAAPATQVISELSSKFGLKLAAIPSFEKSVLVIEAKDVVLKDLLDRIAAVTTGEWKTESDGTMRLGRNSAAEAREVREEANARLVAVNKALKKIADSLKPGAKKEPGGFGMMMGGGAGATSVHKLCASLDPAALAGLEDEGRIVFSTNPTRMQLPFRGAIAPIIRELITNHNENIRKQREAKEKAEQDGKPKNEEQEKMERQMQDVMRIFGFGSSLDPVTAEPQKILLIATRGGGFMGFMGGGINLALNIYDSQGKVILTSQSTIQLEENPFGIPGIGENASKPKQAGTPIPFSKETKELSEFFSLTDWGESLERKPTPELEAKILQPDKFDPLSFSTSEALMFCAKHTKRNLVANVPDSIVSFANLFGGGETTVETFLEELKTGDEVKIEEADGWMVVRPARPSEARKLRVDRKVLARFLNAAKTKDIPSLDDYAAYAAVSASPTQTPIVVPYFLLYVPNAMQQGFGGQMDWNMLKLYGSFGDSQRQSLYSGTPLPFANLSSSQLDVIRKMAYGANSKLEPANERPQREDEMGFFELIARNMPGQIKDFRQEPTEAMPNGLPIQGMLILRQTSDNFVVADDGGKTNRRFGALGVDELAMLRYFSEDKNFAQMAGQMPRIDRIKLGERKLLDFRFRLTPAAMMTAKLNDDRIDLTAATISLEQLPSSFRQRLDKRVDAFKKSPFPMMGMGSGVRPPD